MKEDNFKCYFKPYSPENLDDNFSCFDLQLYEETLTENERLREKLKKTEDELMDCQLRLTDSSKQMVSNVTLPIETVSRSLLWCQSQVSFQVLSKCRAGNDHFYNTFSSNYFSTFLKHIAGGNKRGFKLEWQS